MVEWIKEHPYLVGGTGVGLLILFIIWRNGQSAAASAAPSQAAYGTSDALAAAELQAGAQYQNALLSSQVAQGQTASQTQQSAYAAQVDLAQIAAGTTVSTEQTSAALQLGLAQTAAPLALAGVTGQVTQTQNGIIFGAAGQTSNAQAIQTAQGDAITTAANAPVAIPTGLASNPSYTPPAAQPGTATVNTTPGTCGPGMHFASGACIYDPNSSSVGAQWAVSQANDAIWNANAMSGGGGFPGMAGFNPNEGAGLPGWTLH